MNNKITKGFTIILFSSLIIFFVTYKSGYLNGNSKSSSSQPSLDTLVTKPPGLADIDTFKSTKMLSSSKSLIIRDLNLYTIDSLGIPTPLLPSSKIGFILKPEDIEKAHSDSVKIDTLNQK